MNSSFFLQASFLLLVVTTTAVDQTELVRLDYDNYDEVTNSKTVFIKFYAPWCGHCKILAPDWVRLAKIWGNDDIGLIAEVDCTDNAKGGGRMLCEHFGIESFPTLKYGDPNDLKDYNGKRTLQELSTFAKEQLVPLCSPSNWRLCSGEALANMKKYLTLPVNELQKMIDLEEKKLEEAEKVFDAEVRRLTEEYEAAEEEKRSIIKKVSEGDLNLMKQIIWAKEASYEKEDSDNDTINDEL